MAYFPEPAELAAGLDDAARKRAANWDRLMEVRDVVLKHLDTARNEKLIGAPLEARVRLSANGELYTLLEQYADELPGAVHRVAGGSGAGGRRRAWRQSGARGGRSSASAAGSTRWMSAATPSFPTICAPCAGASTRSSMADLRVKAYGIAAGVFALDRLSKWIVESNVSAMDTVRVIPGLFNIVHSENRGMAFGIMNDSTNEWRTTLLLVLSAAAVVFVAAMLWSAQRLDRYSFWGLTLILGGAAGNVFDRAVWGRVTDFLDFYIRDYHWHTFNVADSAIVIGSGLLLLDLLRPKRQAANVP